MRIFLTAIVYFTYLLTFSQSDVTQLKKELETTATDKERTEVLLKIVDHFVLNDRQTDSAFYFINKLQIIASKNSDSILYAKIYHGLTRAHYLDSDYELTEVNGKKAIALFKTNKMVPEAARVKRILGNMHQVLYQNKKAIDYLKEAEADLSGIDLVLTHIGLATVSRQINDLDQSISYYNQAFDLSNEIGNKDYLYDIYNGLATVYNANNDSNKALESMAKALREATRTNDYLAQVVCYHNIGYLHKGLGNYEEAEQNFTAAIALFDKMSNKFMKASTRMYFAETLLLQNDLKTAEIHLSDSEDLYNQIGNTGRIPTVLNIKARIELAKGNTSKSIALLKKAITISEKNEITGITQNNYLRLSEAYEAINNSEEALTAYKKYETIKDSIARRKKTKEIETQKIKFDIANYELQLKSKNQELALSNEKEKANNYRMALLGFFTLGLIFFIYRQTRMNRAKRKALEIEKELIHVKEEKLRNEMQYKNSEITEFALQINERNKLLDTFNQMIRKIKAKTDNSTKNQLSELQLYLNNTIEVNKEKVTLNSKGRETEESFIYKLKHNYSKLSPKELKVATYLRLNLPSKQIAAQMGIAEQSVNNYRRAIRKKLRLKKEDNLSDFLRNLL